MVTLSKNFVKWCQNYNSILSFQRRTSTFLIYSTRYSLSVPVVPDAMACAYIIAALLFAPLVFDSRGQLALYHLGLCACIILFFGCNIMAYDTPAEIYQAWEMLCRCTYSWPLPCVLEPKRLWCLFWMWNVHMPNIS